MLLTVVRYAGDLKFASFNVFPKILEAFACYLCNERLLFLYQLRMRTTLYNITTL